MLRPGPWGAASVPEATQPGGGTGGRSDAPGRSLAKYVLVARVESSAGDKWSDPNAGPFLSWVVCLRSISRLQTGRAGFLKSACPTRRRAQILEHPWSSEATSSRPPHPGLLCR